MSKSVAARPRANGSRTTNQSASATASASAPASSDPGALELLAAEVDVDDVGDVHCFFAAARACTAAPTRAGRRAVGACVPQISPASRARRAPRRACPAGQLLRVLDHVDRHLEIAHGPIRPVAVRAERRHAAREVVAPVAVIHLEIERVIVDQSEKLPTSIETHTAEHPPAAHLAQTGELLAHVVDKARADRHQRTTGKGRNGMRDCSGRLLKPAPAAPAVRTRACAARAGRTAGKASPRHRAVP